MFIERKSNSVSPALAHPNQKPANKSTQSQAEANTSLFTILIWLRVLHLDRRSSALRQADLFRSIIQSASAKVPDLFELRVTPKKSQVRAQQMYN